MFRLLALLARLLVRVEVVGLENFPRDQELGIVIANHRSLFDCWLLRIFLPGSLHFVAAPERGGGLFRLLCSTTALDPDSSRAGRNLARQLKDSGERLVVFPEGRVSTTGGLMRIEAGAAFFAAQLADSLCVPVHIAGSDEIPFARGTKHWRLRAKVVITIDHPRQLAVPAGLCGTARRQAREHALRHLLERAALTAALAQKMNLAQYLVRNAGIFGSRAELYREVVPAPRRMTLRTLVRACFVLGPELAEHHNIGERVALFLPTSIGAATVFWSCQFAGVVPVLLNLGASAADLSSCCRTASVGTLYTSRALLERIDPTGATIARLRADGIAVVMLEDVRSAVSLRRKLSALMKSLAPRANLLDMPGGMTVAADAEAVILFTSGSEGKPKGVVLSHNNLIANCEQVRTRVATSRRDLLFSSLPVFHSFGLIGGIIMPVGFGLRCFLYPSPLHYRRITELIHEQQATIFFSTSTFLAKYAATGRPDSFNSLRLVIAGGEKLRVAVSRLWADRFGKRVLEGYGVTETSPVLALCSDWQYKAGSIGPLLPGIEARLGPVPGVDVGGELQIRGVNVMAGYLLPEQRGEIKAPVDGWHATGDVVRIDDDGFVWIIDRLKRFAKVAGELVPLARIEDALSVLFDEPSAVLAVPDGDRGEVLVLVHAGVAPTQKAIREVAAAAGLPALWIPRRLLRRDDFALLPTGKPDYSRLASLVRDVAAAPKVGVDQ